MYLCMFYDNGCTENILIIFYFSSSFAIREVAKAVARVIALALDLEVDFFDKPEMLGKPIAILRLLHYEGERSWNAII